MKFVVPPSGGAMPPEGGTTNWPGYILFRKSSDDPPAPAGLTGPAARICQSEPSKGDGFTKRCIAKTCEVSKPRRSVLSDLKKS
ncbi:hypothetical protein QUF80_12520 [Desulfococcaceae bacterium HSG8]|nr:hypothetical protein [Desulfococcaceae bacterium HSG8]